MGMLIISIFVIFSISLLEFIDRSEWEELEEKNALRLTKNRAYGAFKIRSQQSIILVGIVAIVLVLTGLYITVDRIGFGGPDNSNVLDKSSQHVDTTQFALDMENQVDEAPPSAFNQRGDNGDNIPRAQKAPEKMSDRPERNSETSNSPKPEKPKKMTQEEYQKALEKGFFDELDGEAKRKKIKDDYEKYKKEQEEKNKQKQTVNGTDRQAGTTTSNQGNVSVQWIFSDSRKAYEDNDKNVPPPAYTCGNDVDATVKVKIKVDGAGKVIEATVISSTDENSCIKDNARKYALKSRFDLSSKTLQEGTIIYRYKAK